MFDLNYYSCVVSDKIPEKQVVGDVQRVECDHYFLRNKIPFTCASGMIDRNILTVIENVSNVKRYEDNVAFKCESRWETGNCLLDMTLLCHQQCLSSVRIRLKKSLETCLNGNLY